ncbi:BtpA/SgcQ family protein [Microbacterium sp. ASV49]|uniref:BtpA/SgcQ family protein n=1 Tax=Microbacterium candidum TaxID=3041922 RepID=A0ABT7N3L6_9MICO|nr:BtpA/SgcQ family protein [Microbacterium sp. ASV49]MDL9981268.1 BtpA/SgcQ family protein [Microbacterium sp. ASV49]
MTAPTIRRTFDAVFRSKPLLAMLHLKGEDPDDRLARAVAEIDILVEAGVDAVIVENYFGGVSDMERVLAHLASRPDPITYGVNALDQDARGFELAREYDASFLQLDSVAGHLPAAADAEFASWLAEERGRTNAVLLGGVRFKYQPYLSGNPLDVDLTLATDRCDAVVVTGSGTGVQTDGEKIAEFRRLLPAGFPLIVGAGVTVDNAAEQLASTDGAIVGSYLKDTHTDNGDVDPQHAAELVAAFARVRNDVASVVEGAS